MASKFQTRLEELKQKYGSGSGTPTQAPAPSVSPTPATGGTEAIRSKMFQRLGVQPSASAPSPTVTPTPAVPAPPPVEQRFDESPSLVVDMPEMPKYTPPTPPPAPKEESFTDLLTRALSGVGGATQASKPVSQAERDFITAGRDGKPIEVPKQVYTDEVSPGEKAFLQGFLIDPLASQAGATRMMQGDTPRAMGLKALAQQASKETDAAVEWKDWEGAKSLVDPEWWKTSGLRAIGSGAHYAPKSIAGVTAGAVTAPVLGLSGTGALIYQAAVSGLATRPFESLGEAGQVYDQLIDQGATEEQAKQGAQRVFWGNMALLPADMAQALIGIGWLKGIGKTKVGKVVLGGKNPFVQKGISAVTKAAGIATGAASEGAEEVLQEGLQRYGQGAAQGMGLNNPAIWDWDQQYANAFGSGFAAGLPFQLASAPFDSDGRQTQEPAPAPETQPETPVARRDVLKDGLRLAEQLTGRIQPIWPPGKPIRSDLPVEQDAYEQAMARTQQQALSELSRQSQRMTPEFVEQPQTTTKTEPRIDRYERERQAVVALFSDRPDIQKVLNREAQSVPLTAVGKRGEALPIGAAQQEALSQFVAGSQGHWVMQNGSLVYRGPNPNRNVNAPEQARVGYDQAMAKSQQRAGQEMAKESQQTVKGQATPAPQTQPQAQQNPLDVLYVDKPDVIGVLKGQKQEAPVGALNAYQAMVLDDIVERSGGVLALDKGVLRATIPVKDSTPAPQQKAAPVTPQAPKQASEKPAPVMKGKASDPMPVVNNVPKGMNDNPKGEPVVLSTPTPPKEFGQTVKAGDKVAIEGREGVYEVVKATDPSMVTVRTESGAEMPVGRKAVKPVEQTTPPQTPPTPVETGTPVQEQKPATPKTSPKPFGDVSSADEARYHGSEVTIIGDEWRGKKEPDIDTTVVRVLNGGSLVEVRQPGSRDPSASIRVPGNKIVVRRVVDNKVDANTDTPTEAKRNEPQGKPYIPLGDLIAHYKAQGMSKQLAWDQYVKDVVLGQLQSEQVDAKDVYAAYDAVDKRDAKLHPKYPGVTPATQQKGEEKKELWQQTRATAVGEEPAIPDTPRPLEKRYGKNWADRPDAEELRREHSRATSARSKALKAHKEYVDRINAHMRSVQKAVDEGQSVPAEVLAEYPSIQRQVQEKKGKPAKDTQGFAGARPTAPTTQAKPLSPVKRKQIVDFLNQKFAPIKTGGVKGWFLGTFNKRTGVIRTKTAEDFPVQMHEVGHKLDLQLGLSTDRSFDAELLPMGEPTTPPSLMKDRDYLRAEGVAEFLRQYMMDPAEAQAKAPRYYAAFESVMQANPDIHLNLLEARQMVQRWFSQDPKEKVLGTISVGEKDPALPFSFGRLYQKAVEEFQPLQQVVQKVTGKKELPIDEDPYLQARLVRGWTGLAETFIRRGVVDRDFNKVGESFEDIMGDVDNEDDFRAYIVAKRAQEKMDQGLEPEQLLGVGITADEINQVVKELEPKYGKLQKRLVKFQDAVLRQLVDAEVLSKEAADQIRLMNQEYVPFYRLMDPNIGTMSFASTTKFGNLSQPVKKLKGSGRTIIDPLESVIKNTYTILNVAARNRVAVALDKLAETTDNKGEWWTPVSAPVRPVDFDLGSIKKALEDQGVDVGELDLDKVVTIFAPSGKPRAAQNELTLFRDGKRKYVQVNEDIYRAMLGMETEASNTLVKLLSYPASWLRAGATLTPDFSAFNPIKDQFTAAIQSKYGYRWGFDMARGMFNVIGKTELYWKWKAAGGDQAAMVSIDRDSLQEQLDQFIKDQTTKGRIGQVIRKGNPLLYLRAFSEVMENSTRFGENLRAIEVQAKEQGKLPQNRSLADRLTGRDLAAIADRYMLMEAALASRDVTTDFARKGTHTHSINRVRAFFGAAVQGLDKTARTFRDNPVRTTIRASIAFTLPTILLYLLNRENPWYEEKQEWEKDAFWFVPLDWSNPTQSKHFLWIPKSHVYGMVFGGIPERILRWVDKNDKQAFDGEFAKRFAETFTPTSANEYFVPLPTALIPLLEVSTNHDFYTDMPLVPQREMRLEPKDRYGPYTSEVAKLVGKTNKDALAPRNIDQLISGYGGGLGTLAVKGVDSALDATGLVDRPPTVDRGPAGYPVLRRFLRDKGGPGQGSSVEVFYDVFQKMEQKYASMSEGSAKKKFLKELSPWRKVNDKMSDLRVKKRDVLADPDMDSKEKRQKVDEYDLEITNMARQALGKDPINE